MTGTDIAVGVAIAVGLVGIVVPVLPGSVLVLIAICVWAAEVGSGLAWSVFAVAAALIATGAVVKYLLPGRRMKASGIPTSTLWTGALLGIVGFFVIPVIGLLIGFVLGVYLAEWRRVGGTEAWPATVVALKAVGLGILIEFAFASLAALVWAVAVLAL